MQVGAVLAEKYRIDSLLGRGGMGSVWRATHLGLHAEVAVKLIDAGIIDNPEVLARFHREARAAASLRSPHVVQVLDHGVDPRTGAPFIVMELMDGESLAQRLERLGQLPPGETSKVITHVARALTRAHEAGIVHRDLKPDNIFLVRNDDEELAKVLDFGIAKSGEAIGPGTRTGAMLGTPYYMSPEQISGTRVDARTDLWALGVIACECLTGKRPFDAETIGGLTLQICIEPLPAPSSLGRVPAGFDAWFSHAMARDPAQRFASARELGDELRRVCLGTSDGAAASYVPAVSRAPGSVTATVAALTPSPLSLTTGAATAAPEVRRSRAVWLVLGGLLLAAGAGLLFVLRPMAPLETESGTASQAVPSPPPLATPEHAVSTAGTPPVLAPSPSLAPTPAALPVESATATPRIVEPAPRRAAPRPTSPPSRTARTTKVVEPPPAPAPAPATARPAPPPTPPAPRPLDPGSILDDRR